MVRSGIDFSKSILCHKLRTRAHDEAAWAPQANNFWADPASGLTGMTKSRNQTVWWIQIVLDASLMLWGDALATTDPGAAAGALPYRSLGRSAAGIRGGRDTL